MIKDIQQKLNVKAEEVLKKAISEAYKCFYDSLRQSGVSYQCLKSEFSIKIKSTQIKDIVVVKDRSSHKSVSLFLSQIERECRDKLYAYNYDRFCEAESQAFINQIEEVKLEAEALKNRVEDWEEEYHA